MWTFSIAHIIFFFFHFFPGVSQVLIYTETISLNLQQRCLAILLKIYVFQKDVHQKIALDFLLGHFEGQQSPGKVIGRRHGRSMRSQIFGVHSTNVLSQVQFIHLSSSEGKLVPCW